MDFQRSIIFYILVGHKHFRHNADMVFAFMLLEEVFNYVLEGWLAASSNCCKTESNFSVAKELYPISIVRQSFSLSETLCVRVEEGYLYIWLEKNGEDSLSQR